MSDLLPFVIAVFGLLATPGPTNTLMTGSGAQRGIAGSMPLLAGELGGYFIAITVWTELIGRASSSQPWVGVAAKFLAVAFIVWTAWKLWSSTGNAELNQRGITLGRVFSTTLINPKGLVFAFGIFPAVGFVERLPYLGVLALLVIVTALGWMTLGAVAARTSAGILTSARISRIVAVALVVFVTILALQTIRSLQ